MSAIVSMEWVREHLETPDIVLVDCRFWLGKPDAGREAYVEGHLPGAVYMDLERDLSAPVTEHGGRHPLPPWAEFAGKLGAAGIDGSKRVVAYDDQDGAMASRLWWMLRALGHPHVQVMDGGFGAWREAGFPVTRDVPRPEARVFEPLLQAGMIAGMEEVRDQLGDAGTVLVDSREPRRYAGLEEAIDRAAGHIPGAVNRFWKDGRGTGGRFLPAEAQRARFADLADAREIVVYCGSGVTACPNVLALYEAGFENVKLYPGSWSDWISYEENPIAVGEE